jgi:hypothetical protein
MVSPSEMAQQVFWVILGSVRWTNLVRNGESVGDGTKVFWVILGSVRWTNFVRNGESVADDTISILGNIGVSEMDKPCA